MKLDQLPLHLSIWVNLLLHMPAGLNNLPERLTKPDHRGIIIMIFIDPKGLDLPYHSVGLAP